MSHRTFILLATAFLASCRGGDAPTEPASHVPALGHYAYDAEISRSYGNQHLSGELVLTYTSADSLAGYWTVPAYEPELSLGMYNVDAYVLYAHIASSDAIFTHRVSVGDGPNDLICTGHLLEGDGNGGLKTTPGSCNLTYLAR